MAKFQIGSRGFIALGVVSEKSMFAVTREKVFDFYVNQTVWIIGISMRVKSSFADSFISNLLISSMEEIRSNLKLTNMSMIYEAILVFSTHGKLEDYSILPQSEKWRTSVNPYLLIIIEFNTYR